jgi:hypothetical protein
MGSAVPNTAHYSVAPLSAKEKVGIIIELGDCTEPRIPFIQRSQDLKQIPLHLESIKAWVKCD